MTGDVRMEVAPIPTKSLRLRHSLLVYLFNHNILSTSSSKNEVRVMDMYFLDKLEAGLGNVSGFRYLQSYSEPCQELQRLRGLRKHYYMLEP